MEEVRTPWWTMWIFGLVVEGIFTLALVMSFMGEDKTLLNVMCTAAVAQAGVFANFVWGSSQGSRKKDDTLGGLSASFTKTEVMKSGDTTVTTGTSPGSSSGGTAPADTATPPRDKQ